MTEVWPLAAAKWRGAEPDEPMIGDEESLLQTEYHQDNLNRKWVSKKGTFKDQQQSVELTSK